MVFAHVPQRVAAAAAATLAATMLLSGCSAPGADGDSGDEGLVIGVSLYSQVQPRWQYDAAAFEARAKENGDEVIMQFADGDNEKQTQQVESMLSRGVDVLVIAPTDASVAASYVRMAAEENVPVLMYDAGFKDAQPAWFIERRQREVGELQSKAALEAVPEGNYAILKGDPGAETAQASGDAYAELLGGAAGVNIVFEDFIPGWDPATAQQVAENVLTRNHDGIDAFITNNDGIATGVIAALKDAGLNGKVFVSGLDADEANLHAIAIGDQTMTLYTPVDVMASDAADAAHALGTGKEPKSDEAVDFGAGDVPTRYVPMVVVTADNLCEVVTKTLPKGWADPAVVFEGSDIPCDY